MIFNFLTSLAHELTHYFQWYFKYTDSGERTERSLEQEATRWAMYLVGEYWFSLYGEDENGFLKLPNDDGDVCDGVNERR